MKRKPIVWLAILLTCVLLTAVYVVGQQNSPSSTPDPIDSAIRLFNSNQLQQAEALLASVPTNSPEYGEAQCYYALCQFNLNDKKGFLKTVQSIAVQQAAMTPEMSEALAFDEIDSLYFYRRFDLLLTETQAYLNQNPNSPRAEAVSEYAMAGLFERGLKKMRESVILTSTNQSNSRLSEGTTNLNQFLSLVEAFQYTNYVYLTKRSLTKDVWTSGMALGGDTTLLNAIQGQGAATLEQFKLMQIALHKMLHPDQPDVNLRLMTNFVNQFPSSTNLMRVQFDIADISYPRGERLWQDANTYLAAGQPSAAATARALAHQYFLIERAAQLLVTTNQGLGLLSKDVLDLRDDLLSGYYLEGNYGAITNQTAAMLKEAKQGDVEWMLATIYNGMALMGQSETNMATATAGFDAVMAVGFTGQPDNDHKVLDAAGWRLNVAKMQGDWPKAFQIVKWVQNSQCCKNQQEAFMATHSYFAGSKIINGTLYQP